MEDKHKYGNRKIAYYMGYVYYHPGVDIDVAECYGCDYQRFEIFSRIPILVSEYPDDDQYYFAELPNPDYQKEKPVEWGRDLKTIGWNTLNYGEYIRDLKYHSDWNQLMPVCKKIIDSYHSNREGIFRGLHLCDIDKTYDAVIDFIDWWNDPSEEKLTWNDSPDWVVKHVESQRENREKL